MSVAAGRSPTFTDGDSKQCVGRAGPAVTNVILVKDGCAAAAVGGEAVIGLRVV